MALSQTRQQGNRRNNFNQIQASNAGVLNRRSPLERPEHKAGSWQRQNYADQLTRPRLLLAERAQYDEGQHMRKLAEDQHDLAMRKGELELQQLADAALDKKTGRATSSSGASRSPLSPTKGVEGFYYRSLVNAGYAPDQLRDPETGDYTPAGSDFFDAYDKVSQYIPDAPESEKMEMTARIAGLRTVGEQQRFSLSEEKKKLSQANMDEKGYEKPRFWRNESGDFHNNYDRIQEIDKQLSQLGEQGGIGGTDEKGGKKDAGKKYDKALSELNNVVMNFDEAPPEVKQQSVGRAEAILDNPNIKLDGVSKANLYELFNKSGMAEDVGVATPAEALDNLGVQVPAIKRDQYGQSTGTNAPRMSARVLGDGTRIEEGVSMEGAVKLLSKDQDMPEKDAKRLIERAMWMIPRVKAFDDFAKQRAKERAKTQRIKNQLNEYGLDYE